MPRKNDLPSFGPEFEALLNTAHAYLAKGHEEYAIDFATPKLAHNIKFRLFAYFKALKNCGDRLDLTAKCTGLSIRVGTGGTLILYRRGDDLAAAAIRDALGLPKDFHTDPAHDPLRAPSPLDASRDALERIRERTGKK